MPTRPPGELEDQQSLLQSSVQQSEKRQTPPELSPQEPSTETKSNIGKSPRLLKKTQKATLAAVKMSPRRNITDDKNDKKKSSVPSLDLAAMIDKKGVNDGAGSETQGRGSGRRSSRKRSTSHERDTKGSGRTTRRSRKSRSSISPRSDDGEPVRC